VQQQHFITIWLLGTITLKFGLCPNPSCFSSRTFGTNGREAQQKGLKITVGDFRRLEIATKKKAGLPVFFWGLKAQQKGLKITVGDFRRLEIATKKKAGLPVFFWGLILSLALFFFLLFLDKFFNSQGKFLLVRFAKAKEKF
jgi:hypothetical protein